VHKFPISPFQFIIHNHPTILRYISKPVNAASLNSPIIY